MFSYNNKLSYSVENAELLREMDCTGGHRIRGYSRCWVWSLAFYSYAKPVARIMQNRLVS